MTAEAARCLSVVMPCFNEIATIGSMVDRVLASEYTAELIIVDDGSTDGTADYLRKIDDPRVTIIIQPANQGKGAALRMGLEKAKQPFVIIQDADEEYDPKEYPVLLRPLLSGKADVVYGSRFLPAGERRVLYFWHSLGNRILTSASNMLNDLNLTDMETCYKVFRQEVLQSFRIEENRFGVEPEITAKVARGRWRIFEVGISYAGRTYAEGKKINWKDGLWALYCIVKYSALVGRPLHPDPGQDSRSIDVQAADVPLASTLESLDEAHNYSAWIYSMMEPFLGEKVLEVGAGHGTFTEIMAPGRQVTATDASTRCEQLLAERFGDRHDVIVKNYDAQDPSDQGGFDSVVLINVLEHLDDDAEVVRRLGDALRPGGHLVVFVPAFQGLYGEFDRSIGHRRRYTRSGLTSLMHSAGLEPVADRYVNLVGFFAWWVLVRRLGMAPTSGQLVRLYDRVVVPVLRPVEKAWEPPFGQSVFVAARRPAGAEEPPG